MNKSEREVIALKHTKYMEDNYSDETEYSIENSKLYDNTIFINKTNNIEPYAKINGLCKILIADMTTENAVEYCVDKLNLNDICALNFASFTRPGGGFIKGSIAQEEALCHSSNLYNILSHFTNLYNVNYILPERMNKSMYINWAIYSPDVAFIYEEKTDNENAIAVNIITCPAPNYSAYSEKIGANINDELYNKNLYDRIKYILDIAEDNKQENLILGAFGCGVFGNNPYIVANIFKDLILSNIYHFKNIIFAIPDGKNNNLSTFKNVFK